ncbi:MAG: hypothetical protein ABFE07_10235 [Armatimonadia bacterium]|nr:hypothetical protein [Planctomycetaceae bacterium]
MRILALTFLLSLVANRPPSLGAPLVRWQGWPYPQQREVMRQYKLTGVLYKYPAWTGENPFEETGQ